MNLVYESRLFRKAVDKFNICDKKNNCDVCSKVVECVSFFDAFVVNEPKGKDCEGYIETIVKRLGKLARKAG